MRFLKYFLLFITIVLITGCSQTEDYSVLSAQVRSQTAKQLKKEKDLIPVGSGGQMIGDIQLARIMFQYFHLVNLEEARELFVYATILLPQKILK